MGVETYDVDESLYSILTMINNGTWQIIQRFPLQLPLVTKITCHHSRNRSYVSISFQFLRENRLKSFSEIKKICFSCTLFFQNRSQISYIRRRSYSICKLSFLSEDKLVFSTFSFFARLVVRFQF